MTQKPNSQFTICLWCNHDAQQKAEYYCSVFADSKITSQIPGVTTSFELQGNKFLALNGHFDFEYNNTVSLVVNCRDQEEVDYYWNRFIGDGGRAMDCSWCQDKYGLRWQIVPIRLMELLSGTDPVKSGRVMAAMQKMQKIVIEDLERAYQERE